MTKPSVRSFQKPSCLTLALCEQVIEDKRTNNKSLIGVFSRINGLRFPFVYPRLFVFVTLTGGRGEVPVQIHLTNFKTNKVILNLKGKAAFKSPLTTTDLILECRNVPFKEAGTHGITIMMEKELIAERRFDVRLNPQRKAP